MKRRARLLWVAFRWNLVWVLLTFVIVYVALVAAFHPGSPVEIPACPPYVVG